MDFFIYVDTSFGNNILRDVQWVSTSFGYTDDNNNTVVVMAYKKNSCI